MRRQAGHAHHRTRSQTRVLPALRDSGGAHGFYHRRHVVPCDPARQADARIAVRGCVPRFRRRVDRQHRVAVNSAFTALLGSEPDLGAERLPAHLRGVHAARRPRGRPDRPPASPDQRRSGDRRLVADRRVCRKLGRARRRPPRSRPRRGDDASRRPIDPHHQLQRGQGSQHRTGGSGEASPGSRRRLACCSAVC